jgi:hypothetical protein
MAFMDKIGAGLEQAAREIELAFDKGKGKVSELQIEMQLDALAKKLGYLVFDFYRGRPVDQAVRQKVLDDLSRLEDQLWKIRAESAAKAEADAQARAARKAGYGQPGQQPGPEPGPQPGQQAPTPSDWDLGNQPQQPGGGETYRPPNP